MKYVSIAVVLAFIVGLIATAAFAKNDNEPRAPHKVYVCKYVGTPGVDETLQTESPIEVDTHALEGDGFAGNFPFAFSDAHGKSIAIGWSGDGYPVLGNCPPPVQEEPTQVEASVQAVNPTCDDPDGSTIGLILGNEDEIDYSVEGNIAPGETVDVSATAEDGFELVGQDEFEITFDSFDQATCQGDGGEGVASEKGSASVAPVVTSKAPSGGDLPFTL